MFSYCVCASQGAGPLEPVLYRGSYEQAFDYAKQLGYDGIEIHLRAAADVDAQMLERMTGRTGVRVAAIATGLAKRMDGLSLIDENDMAREAALERLMGHLDLADRFGCPVIIGSARSNIPSPDKRAYCLDRLEESLHILAAYIREKDCAIVLEAINRYENNYLNTARETADFLDRLAEPKVKMLLDTFHMNIEEQDTLQALRQTSAHLGHFHIGENTRWYPGRGQIDFPAILRTLREIGYTGWVSMEYLPLPDERKAAAQGLRNLKEIEKNLI